MSVFQTGLAWCFAAHGRPKGVTMGEPWLVINCALLQATNNNNKRMIEQMTMHNYTNKPLCICAWLLFLEAVLRQSNGKILRLALRFGLQLELNTCVWFCILIIQVVPLFAWVLRC